ncbi:MAG TPA: hypothetical protein PKA64_22235 [Myxococcota bacterium]|nr:hypothetical protein [Myxococcota bacterium]
MRNLLLLSSLVGCVPETAAPWDHAPPPAPCTPAAAAMFLGAPYASIQDALDAAVATGGVITVCEGVHGGDLDVHGAGPVWLVGETGDPADVILDGQGADALVAVAEPVNVLGLSGVTLRDGFAEPRANGRFASAVLHAVDDGALFIADCRFSDNITRSDEAAVMTSASRVRVERTVFERNQGGVAGALNVVHRVRGAQVTLDDVDLIDNVGGLAGGVWISAGSNQPPPGVDRYELSRVRARGNEGGSSSVVSVEGVHAMHLTVDRSSFVDNTASGSGGAVDVSRLLLERGQRVTVSRTTFRGNRSAQGAALTLAGRSTSKVATAELVDVRVGENRSIGPGVLSVGPGWAVDLRHVDLGVGPHANTGDVAGCAADFGRVTTGHVEPDRGDLCP